MPTASAAPRTRTDHFPPGRRSGSLPRHPGIAALAAPRRPSPWPRPAWVEAEPGGAAGAEADSGRVLATRIERLAEAPARSGGQPAGGSRRARPGRHAAAGARRPRRPWLAGLVAVAAAGVLVLGLTLPSAATGVPRTARPTAGGVSPVRDRLAALTIREEKSVEQFDRTRITLAAARARLHAVDRRLHRARVELGAARHAMSQLAAAAYQGGGGLSGSELQLLLTTDPQTFVSSSSDLQAVSHRTASVLRRLERLTASLAAVRAQALHEERVAAAAARRLAADRARILATIAAERALQAQAGPSVTSAASPAYPPPAGSGPGAVAVRFAYRQLGKPYEWGAAGPDAYDCSGLTMAAWGAAGVSLPHSAADQQGMTTPVSASDLSPGDLIFFGSPAYHVGIYIGDGDMIDAPHTGTDVQINPISGYTSAGRP